MTSRFAYTGTGGAWLFPAGTLGLPAAGVALPSTDLTHLGSPGDLGFAPIDPGISMQIPMNSRLVVDLYDPRRLVFVDRRDVQAAQFESTSEPRVLAQVEFEEPHPAAWVEEIDQTELLLILLCSDVFLATRCLENQQATPSPPTNRRFLQGCHIGLAPLALRSWADGQIMHRAPLSYYALE